MVTALQRRGEVVADTGDGANDAPALKHADIGVAMGASGTDAAREAAVMVLLDDSFASITTAVGLGRSVHRNIRKFLIHLFSHNIAELVPILAATFAGFPLVPITAVQILAIDLGSDVLPAPALGAEPMERDVLDSPPRPRRERQFSTAVMGRVLFLGGIQALGVCTVFFWHIHASGIPYTDFTKSDPVHREAITMVQAGIVVSQFFNALAVRTDRQSVFRVGSLTNPRLLAAGFFGIGLTAAISYAPPLRAVFNTAPLPQPTGRFWPRSEHCCRLPRKYGNGFCGGVVLPRRGKHDESDHRGLRAGRGHPRHTARRRRPRRMPRRVRRGPHR
ncbi:HAD-IC family P-type ATPase [Streptomyces sp. NPDC054771]